jgi:hypothetical protein
VSEAVKSKTSAEGVLADTLDDVTRQLLAWLNKSAPALRFSCEMTEPGDKPCMQVSLLRIRPGAAPSNPSAPLELHLDYLCTVVDGNAPVVQRALGEIAFAALECGTYGVSATESGRLGLVLTARLFRKRNIPRGPRARSGLRTDLRPLGTLSGILLGPGQVTVSGASVWIADKEETQSRTATGQDGRFRLIADAKPGQEILLGVEINARRHVARGVAGGSEIAFLIGMEE